MTIPDANTDMQTKQEWIKELNIMSQLRSNTVTHVYGYSEHANEFLIIMEFVDGGSLRNLLDNKIKFANMTFQDKWALMRQAAESVAFLHERGIVHRDIKSLNFLVTLFDTW
jgi:serine/threonine protein kinase